MFKYFKILLKRKEVEILTIPKVRIYFSKLLQVENYLLVGKNSVKI